MDELQEFTDPYSADTGQEEEQEKYVTFKSGNEYFAIRIEYVSEIIQIQPITMIPESEDYVKGLINLRGKIIPVIDVRLRFCQEPFEYNDRTCIIVINVNSTIVGLVVEKIAEVVEIREKKTLPQSSVGRSDKAQNKYVFAIGKVGDYVKLLLDPERLLNDVEGPSAEQAGGEPALKEEEK